MQTLKNEYTQQDDLTEGEKMYIIGISNSVSAYVKALSEMEKQFSSQTSAYPKSKRAGVLPAYLMLQLGGDDECDTKEARDNFTDENCEFDPDWGLILGKGALGGTVSSTVATFSTAAYLMASPDPMTNLALGFSLGGAALGGDGYGAFTEWSNQRDRHDDFIDNNVQDQN